MADSEGYSTLGKGFLLITKLGPDIIKESDEDIIKHIVDPARLQQMRSAGHILVVGPAKATKPVELYIQAPTPELAQTIHDEGYWASSTNSSTEKMKRAFAQALVEVNIPTTRTPPPVPTTLKTDPLNKPPNDKFFPPSFAEQHASRYLSAPLPPPLPQAAEPAPAAVTLRTVASALELHPSLKRKRDEEEDEDAEGGGGGGSGGDGE
ncbi:hypothetical protein HDV00_012469 [Rhizophlyctis rosea]|nr:hypothetical protein HDV00_012469 [Rhizophlyctis rosea]